MSPTDSTGGSAASRATSATSTATNLHNTTMSVLGPQKKGTLTTLQGPISWTQSSDGTIEAQGGGQTAIINEHDGSGGSWQSHAEYSRTGQAVYLSMDLVCDAAARTAEFKLSAGPSQLTLTIANIDALVRSGNAALSGSWNGAAVHWAGPADLTSNSLKTRPIAGWPAGAFASELNQAAFFSTFTGAFAMSVAASPRATAVIKTPGGVIGRAGAWCVGGAIAASGASIGTLGISLALGCAGGLAASLTNDLVSYLEGLTDVGSAILAGLNAAMSQIAAQTGTGTDSSGSNDDSGSSGGGDDDSGSSGGGDDDSGSSGGGGGGSPTNPDETSTKHEQD
jgi:hypothetical protein